LETDYLVVGSGAAGMAFADSLISETDAQVLMVDRRSAPGGHWNDAYPFVRLHQPSLYYGVNSTPLGSDAIESQGPEAGQYERTKGPEICAYYGRVMQRRLVASGLVRFLPNCDYVGITASCRACPAQRIESTCGESWSTPDIYRPRSPRWRLRRSRSATVCP
jgi:choline dehydrogenase-like flavoprotein